MSDRLPASRKRRRRLMSAVLAGAVLVGPVMVAPNASAAPNSNTPYPVFAGSANPVPTVPAAYDAHAMMASIFAADVASGAGSSTGRNFWMDQMLVRTGTQGDANPGNSDNNQWLFSRGRTLFMKSHDPSQLGFGGDVAYIESIDGRGAYTISMTVGGQAVQLGEDTAARKQTPSYWQSTFTGSGLTVVQTKYITDANVAVTALAVTNSSGAAKDVVITATSPYATQADGNELVGQVASFNKLTTISPRLSGDGFTPSGGALTRTVTVPANGSVTTKVQEGFLTADIAESATEYATYRDATPAAAYTKHVVAYNKWWADNIPYIDIPDKNIEKTLYYRWWLMRFNFLDANIAGNDYQFPTAVEGALGYNNAIVLTSGMFIDDLKYLRDPSYAYGTWVSAGEVAKSGKYTDNPGDPANWSNSYTQYITEAAYRSYQLHGGPAPIAASLGTYGENDVKGLLKDFDSNGNKLIEYNWGAMTGNDADAVSFHWRPGANLDRTESAYLYSNALGAAGAYRAAGNEAKAVEMEQLAAQVKQAVLDVLWNPTDKLLEHRVVGGDKAYVPWKETNNYYPFTVGLMPKPDGTPANDQYTEALRLWADSDEYPIFPFFTANQKDKAAAAAAGEAGSNNFSIINSTVTFRFLSSVLRNYPSQYINAETYKKLLYWNAWAQYQSGNNQYPDQNEFWADGSADPQKIGYRSWIHHTILGATNFTVVEDVAGLRTRDDSKIELSPIDIGWDHFTVNNLRYRDKDLSIVWDKPGDGQRYYGDNTPEGYSIYLDGKLVLTLDSLKHLIFDPATGNVELPDGGTVTTSATAAVQAMTQVSFAGDSRVVDIFAKAGKDIVPTDGNPVDLALGATATASFSAAGRTPAGAVDGTTINEPFWGTAGSTNAADTLDIDLGAAKKFDDIRLHFYRSSTSGTVAGYAEPSSYQLSYLDGTTWKAIPGQLRSPSVPAANLNESTFAPVTARKIRVTVTHQPGFKTAIKEALVFSTGRSVTAPGNQAPTVTVSASAAAADGSFNLAGVVKDDGLPAGTLTSAWSVVSAPDGGSAVFTSPSSASTTVKFTASGPYVLRLTANDGALSTTKDVTVTGVVAGASGINVATQATPTAEFTAGWTNINAINDGVTLNTGGQQSQVWGSYSGDRTKTRWLQYTWPSAVRVASTDVTFWYDQPAGVGDGVGVPKSWTLQYLAADGKTWTDVSNPSGYGVARTGSNTTTFDPISTTALRAVFTADGNGTTNAAVSVSEWAVRTDVPVSTAGVNVRTNTGVVPTMPGTVEQVYSDGTRVQNAVTWPVITAAQVAAVGSVKITGVVDGGGTVAGTVWVRDAGTVQINTFDPITATTAIGRAPSLPGTVTAGYNDGSFDSRILVTWAAVPAESYAKAGTFTVSGTVAGTDKTATATVTVIGGGAQQPDTTAPVVTLTRTPGAPAGTNGWDTAAVSVAATAVDDRDPAPMVEVDVDGSGWATVSGAISIAADGSHTVKARASDAAGNVSAVQTVAVQLDTTEPVSNSALNGTTRTVTLRGADATSRLERIEYRIGGGAWATYSTPVAVGDAATTVSYAAVDKAGNRETVNILSVPAKTASLPASKTTLSLSGSSVTLGATLTATVAVTSGTAKATGTVVLTAGSAEIGRGTLANGKATIKVDTATMPAGGTTVTATYAGSTTSQGSSATAALTLVKATPKVALSVRGTTTVGSDVTATVTVTASRLIPTGAVEIHDGDTVVGKGVLSANGRSVITLDPLAVGSHSLTVSFPGDIRVAAGTATAAVTVVKATSNVVTKVSPGAVTTQTLPTVAVVVRSAQRTQPAEGQVVVTVIQGEKTIAEVTGVLSGQAATIGLPNLPAGATTITVAYPGSATVQASSSSTDLTVGK